MPDEYLDRIAQTLYAAVVADVLDGLGYRDQVMRHDIRPLERGDRLVGRAATMLSVERWKESSDPYQLEIALVDSLMPGEVVCCGTIGHLRSAIWGELLSTAARARGGRGAVIDGLCRDARDIQEMGFPVFARGLCPADSRGRSEVTEIRKPVQVGGVIVRDGDLVVADDDGCVVVPQGVEQEVVELAVTKAAAESRVRQFLVQGASLGAVFREHGVL